MLEIIFWAICLEISVSCRVTTKCPKYSLIALDAQFVTIIYLNKFGFQKTLRLLIFVNSPIVVGKMTLLVIPQISKFYNVIESHKYSKNHSLNSFKH